MLGEGKINPNVFLQKHNEMIDLVNQQDKTIKIKFILECEFYKQTLDYVEYLYGYFHSKTEIVTKATNLEELYESAIDNILEKVDTLKTIYPLLYYYGGTIIRKLYYFINFNKIYIFFMLN